MDEMRHMGLACNLLTTVGGTPRIHDDMHRFSRRGFMKVSGALVIRSGPELPARTEG
jgi:hypothetical protein